MIKKGKYLLVPMLSLIILSAAPNVYGDSINYDENGQKVYDYAELLSDSEEREITEKLVETSKETKLDLVVVTTNDTQGKSTSLYADDFYDDNGFGYDKKYGDGVLLLIDMEHREVFISTAGDAISRVSDSDVEDILDEIAPFLTNESYMQAVEEFIEGIDDIDDNAFTYLRNPIISLLIALAVAGVAVFIMGMSSKTKVTVGSTTYLEGGRIKLGARIDHFTHTTTTRRKIENDNNHSGSSSVRTSSSGHSHGGGGRSF